MWNGWSRIGPKPPSFCRKLSSAVQECVCTKSASEKLLSSTFPQMGHADGRGCRPARARLIASQRKKQVRKRTLLPHGRIALVDPRCDPTQAWMGASQHGSLSWRLDCDFKQQKADVTLKEPTNNTDFSGRGRPLLPLQLHQIFTNPLLV